MEHGRKSRNKRNSLKKDKYKYGIKIPSNINEAFQLDNENKNHLWEESIQKEMKAMEDMDCFEFHQNHVHLPKE